jgi:hypothetical protein
MSLLPARPRDCMPFLTDGALPPRTTEHVEGNQPDYAATRMPRRPIRFCPCSADVAHTIEGDFAFPTPFAVGGLRTREVIVEFGDVLAGAGDSSGGAAPGRHTPTPSGLLAVAAEANAPSTPCLPGEAGTRKTQRESVHLALREVAAQRAFRCTQGKSVHLGDSSPRLAR